MKYSQFIFDHYIFDPAEKRLSLHYEIDDAYKFTETYRFDFDFCDYNSAALDRACQLLFFMAGISYYKTFLPPEIVVKQGQIDAEIAQFLNKTYQKGLGEFFYVNKLDPKTPVNFPTNSERLEPIATSNSSGKLVGIGGGKDSLVSVELLRKAGQAFSTWSLNHRPQLTPLVERIGSEHYWIERSWDKQLLSLKDSPEAYNGHVPISAIFACVGTVVGILTGKQELIVSNENSANEATLTYQGVDINHQYSKSLEFEKDYQAILAHNLDDTQQYYSLLRPFSELRIAELFAEYGFEKYKDVFSSCNRAFTHGSDHMFWDGTCPKCAFVFLVLTPFVSREAIESLFGSKNLLLDPSLEATYRQLLGIEGDKPLECVGEVKESRAAMRQAQAIYPELKDKYQFELPSDYDYRALATDAMPKEIKEVFVTQLAAILSSA